MHHYVASASPWISLAPPIGGDASLGVCTRASREETAPLELYSYRSFVLDPAYKGRLPQIKEQVLDMALNGSGIRDTARVLKISPTTVINELKKKSRR